MQHLAYGRYVANGFVRFRVGSDDVINGLGWLVDNIALYKCTALFTDDPLAVPGTVIKRIHVAELRTRIDTLRNIFGLQAFNWTDTVLTAGVSSIRAIHVTEMRNALVQAYLAAGVAQPVFTDTNINAGGAVKAVHIQELRNAVIALENH